MTGSKQREPNGRGRPSTADEGTALDHEQLARALGTMARQLQSETEVGAVLADIVATGVHLIPGAQEGSLSVVVNHRTVNSQHPTGPLPEQVDRLQTQTGQGPCLDAVYEQQTVRVSDMRTESRWPVFAAQAAAAGVLSMLSFQLWVEQENLGALNLFSRDADAFSDESEAVGLIFASHAAVAYADLRKVNQLRTALDSRDLIGQAKGILMERHQITSDQAFRVLIRVSQNHNRKLTDVAAQLVFEGALPTLPAHETSE